MTHHVLLIGIDAYDGVSPLNGCVNDIDGIQEVLLERLKIPAASIRRLASPRFDTEHPTTVPEQLPTLANIQAELARLADEEVVKPEDRVFIYYSGHGTQCPVEVSERRFLREALLPKDHYQAAERRFLFDYQINERLAAIAARTRSVSFVLDACCSAGATRDALQPSGSVARYVETKEPYKLPAGQGLDAAGAQGLARSVATSVSDCQVVTACRDDERALEQDDGGRLHGALTRALLAELRQLPQGEDLSALIWGRLWRAVVAQVQAKSPAQNPQMFGSFARQVFGGPPKAGDPGYAITREGDEYRLDAGTLSSVTRNAEVWVYGMKPDLFPPLPSKEGVVARLLVSSADRSSARAKLAEGPAELPAGARGRLAKAGDAAKLVVGAPADAAFAQEIAASPLLRLAEPGDAPDVWLLPDPDGSWEVADDLHGPADKDRATLVKLEPWHAAKGRVRPLLEHYFRYSLPFRMAKVCNELKDALELVLLDCNGFQGTYPREKAAAPDLPPLSLERGGYSLWAGTGGTKPPDRFAIRLGNNAGLRLHVSLVGCTASGRVVELSQRTINPKEVTVVWQGEDVGLPFSMTADGTQPLIIDRLVCIGTTRATVSLDYLEVNQGFLEVLESPPPTTRGGPDPAAEQPEHWASATCILRSRC